jgi:hypothetical protein
MLLGLGKDCRLKKIFEASWYNPMLVERTEEPEIILTKTIKNIKPLNDDWPPRSHRLLGVLGIV